MSRFRLNLCAWCCYLVPALFLIVPACEKSVELGDSEENVGDAEIGVVRNALSLSEFEAVADSTIQSHDPFENNGDSSPLEVTAASAYAIERTLVRFDQTAIEQAVDGQQVTSATLEVTIDGLSMGWDGDGINAHRMLMPWTEDGVTWACANDTWTGGWGDLYNNCSSADEWGMDWWSLLPQPFEETPSATTPIHAYQTGTISFDVTTDVQSFLAGTSNYGWMIAGTDELWGGLWVDFYSRETWHPPKLILEYGPEVPTASVVVDVTNDTYVSQWFPNRNREGETRLKANSDVSTFVKHALVEFADYDISAAMAEQGVVSGYELKSAKLIMTVKDPWPFSLMNFGDLVNVHRMLQPWVVDRVTWECAEDTNPDNIYKDCDGAADWDMVASDPNNRPYLPTATDGQLAEVIYGAEMVWDVTADVAGFRDGTFENYGWLFSKPDDPWLGFISFFSEEGGIPGRLELEFEYRDCTVDQPCGSGQGSCESDDECEPGLVCEFGVEDRFGQPAGVGICWDPECRNDPFTVGCGWRGDPCGICPCVPNCTNKSCGSDGCGGTCNDYCDIGDPCRSDIDCGNNQVCDVIDSSNNRACVPSSCTNGIHDIDETDRDCGGDCKPCSEACPKQFCRSGEQINPDPLATLSFSIGGFTRDSYAQYQTEKGTEFARPNVLRYEDRDDGNGRVALFQGAEGEREADVLVFESSDVPSWMRSGTWQFDVYPYYSSEELTASTGERVLFSFDSSSDRIVLRPVAGSARLAVITDGFTRHERVLTWSAHQKMTITLDTWGGDVTVRGASSNNGEQHGFPFFFSSGRLRVGGLLDDAKEANARISEPRRVSQSTIACTTDANFCTADCPCKSGEGGCSDDSQCEPGLECHAGVGEAHGLPSSYGVCRMPLCNDPSDPRFVCGSVDASCGVCPPCTPDCSGKSCGSNGCWGSCGEDCGQGQAGCNSNADCAEGLVCGVGNGERFGFSPDLRVCWPPICERLDQSGIPCGDIDAVCGLCPVCDAVANCAGRTCGPDGCGGSCGTVEQGQYCDEQTGTAEWHQYLDANGVPIPEIPIPQEVQPVVEPHETETVGSLPGEFRVTNRGAASYTIPIEVPPGRVGMQPRLSLSYNSNSPNSYLGVGWSVNGLSAITRCSQNEAQDEKTRSITFTKEDRFCLDGQRLVLINGNSEVQYGDDGAVYRKEFDDFTKVVQDGADDSGPGLFTAYTRDGRILSYGAHARDDEPFKSNSKVMAQRPGSSPSEEVTHTWALDRIQDRAGNSMDIKYEIQPVKTELGLSREYYPKMISYTHYPQEPSNRGNNKVVFEYKPRNDLLFGFVGGVIVNQSQLLDKIITKIEDRTIREYRFTYDEPPAGEEWPPSDPSTIHMKSRLSEVQVCAQKSQFTKNNHYLACMPKTLFTYDSVEPGFVRETVTDDTSYTQDSERDGLERVVLDINGNGIDDVLMQRIVEPGSFTWILLLDNQTWVNTGITTSSEVRNPYGGVPEYQYLNEAFAYVVDYDHDGIKDIIASDVDASFWDGITWVIKWDPVTARVTRTVVNDIWVSGRKSNYVLDANGDGVEDFLNCHKDKDEYIWWIYWGRTDGPGFREPVRFPIDNKTACAPAIVLDIGADGDDDLLLGSEPPYYDYNEDGEKGHMISEDDEKLRFEILDFQTDSLEVKVDRRLTKVPHTFSDDIDPDEIRNPLPVDFNGDGLKDIVEFGKSNRIYVYPNLGSSFGRYGRQILPESKIGDLEVKHMMVNVIDDNGDGRQDILFRATEDNRKWFLLRSTGVLSQQPAFSVVDLDIAAFLDPPDDDFYKNDFWDQMLTVYDADGDGRKDIGFVEEPGDPWRVLKRRGTVRNLLTDIKDGFGARIHIDYSNLTDRDIYTDLQTACSYPIDCSYPKKIVVSGHQEEPDSTKMSYSRSFSYRYGGSVSDRRGRGWIGFSNRSIIDNKRVGNGQNADTVYFYDTATIDTNTRSYPLASMHIYEINRTIMSGGRTRVHTVLRNLRYTRDEYQYETGETNRMTVFPHEDGRIEIETESDGDPNTPDRVVRHIIFDHDYDKFGNRTSSTAEWQLDPETEPIEKETIAVDYMSDQSYEEAWLISVPRSRTITSEMLVEGEWEQEARTEEYGYYPSGHELDLTGLPKTHTKEPENEYHRLYTEYNRNRYGSIEETQTTGDISSWGYQQTRTTTIEYDGFDDIFVKNISDSNDHSVEHAYDIGTGALIAKKSELNEGQEDYITSLSILDGFGRAAYQVAPDLSVTEIIRLQTAHKPMLVATRGEGQPTRLTQFDGWGRTETVNVEGFDGNYLFQETQYDDLGRVSQTYRPTRDPNQKQWTVFEYDALDRPILTTLPDDKTIEACYRYNVECTRDARGYTTCKQYDHRARLVKVVEADESPVSCEAAIDAMDTRDGMTYIYGPFGSLEKTIDVEDNIITSENDIYGRVTTLTDPNLGERAYMYTPFDEPWIYLDAKGRYTMFEYDELGRKTSRRDLDPEGNPDDDQWTYWYYYNSADPDGGAYGSLRKTESQHGTVEYKYNNLGLVKTIDRTIDDESMQVRFTYNEHSQLKTVTYPTGPTQGDLLVVEHVYNEDSGYLEEVKQAEEDQIYWRPTEFDNFGQLTEERLGNDNKGLITTRTYHPTRGWLESVVTEREGESGVIQSAAYYYDNNGNLETKLEGEEGQEPAVTYYGYDHLNRLEEVLKITESGQYYTEQIQYSRTGNIEEKSRDGVTRIYDYESERPAAVRIVRDPDDPPPYENAEVLTYDENGNLTERTGGPRPNMTLEYTRFDKPNLITVEGEYPVSIFYDADEVRIKKDSGAETTLYFPGYFYKTTDNVTGEEVYNYFIGNGTRVVAQVAKQQGESDRLFYHHDDHLGSTAVVSEVTEDGIVLVQNPSYSAFGEQTYEGQRVTTVGYTGHEYDEEFGLLNMGGRLYDPELGRVLSPDPFIVYPEMPQSYNRYAYVMNNPMAYTDPSGYVIGIDDILLVAAIVVVAAITGDVVFGITGTFGEGVIDIDIGGSSMQGENGEEYLDLQEFCQDNLFDPRCETFRLYPGSFQDQGDSSSAPRERKEKKNSGASYDVQESRDAPLGGGYTGRWSWTGKTEPELYAWLTPDTLIDLGSMAMGYASYLENLEKGNYAAAAADAGGVVFDAIMVAVPGLTIGAAIWLDASRGLTATEKAITQLASKLRFTGTTAAHMAETGRYVPRHILADAILTGKRMPDPQGAPGAVKIVQDVVINQKNRVLEIIYRESDSTILHFLYK